MYVLSVSEMRALESTADVAGHSYAQMMALAGEGVARAVLRRQNVRGRRVLVLVGPGNNGGDGLVAARLLKEAGATVTAYLSRERDAAQDGVFRQAVERGVTVVTARDDARGEELRRLTLQAHVLVDALLGTGATPPLRGTIAEMLRTVRAALAQGRQFPPVSLNRVDTPPPPRPFIVAVDGPSGMDFDSGEVDALTLTAHLTVTFAAPKWGHFRMPAAARVGELVVADIGIPEGIDIRSQGPEVATPQLVRRMLPPRPPDAHKGTFGKAMVVAGSSNYTGAAALAAKAAVRAGAGLVTLAIPGLLHAAIVPRVPEATYLLLPHALGVVAPQAVPLLWERLEGYSALLVGPGLGNTPETRAFLRRLLGAPTEQRRPGFVREGPEATPTPPTFPPMVVDADGLNVLSQLEGWPSLLPPGTVLTPHPGEMARLAHLTTQQVQADRTAVARRYAAQWGHVVVLKGAFTVVAGPDERVVLLPFANPGLSTAGTGDVLAGTIVALLAQGLAPFEAAVAGAYLHGLAGELSRERFGAAGMAAGDVVDALAESWRRLAG